MDVITEYDYESNRRLLCQKRKWINLAMKGLCKHLRAAELNQHGRESSLLDFDVIMHGLNEFTVHLAIELGQNVAVYIHEHSPCTVMIQIAGEIPLMWKKCVNEEGYLSSAITKAVLNLQLSHAFDAYSQSKDYKKAIEGGEFSELSLSYTNIIKIT